MSDFFKHGAKIFSMIAGESAWNVFPQKISWELPVGGVLHFSYDLDGFNKKTTSLS